MTLTAAPRSIGNGEQAKVRAQLRAQDGDGVGLGTVKATPAGATVAPASDRTDGDGIARFRVTAKTDAAALSSRAVSRAGIATGALTLGRRGSFTATLDSVRTDTWTHHTTRYQPGPPPVCNVDSSGTERISTPPEGLVTSPVYYNDGQGLILGFSGFLVLNRNGSYTDSCAGASDTSGCGVDRPFTTLTGYRVVTKDGFVSLEGPATYTNRPPTSCPDFGGPYCDGPDPVETSKPAQLPRAALRDPKQKIITLQGSTSWLIKGDCGEGGQYSTTEQDEVKLEWTITLRRQ